MAVPVPAPPGSALARCIGVALDEFAGSYWSRQALFSPATATGADFTDLLDEAAVDELLSRRGLRTPFIRMAKQGKVIAASAYTRPGGAGAGIADQVADDKVLGLIADGATLVLQALHRNWPPLIDFGSVLATDLGHPVQINAYLTPRQSQGFAAHYDTHDVFVLQVSGTKRWLIHRPVLIDPLPGRDWEKHRAEVAARAGEPPLIEAVLQPGDALYLPRGFLHSAVAQGETSIHLTVGCHPLTRYSLIRQLLALAREDEQLRASLPMGLDLADPAALADELGATVRALTGFTERTGALAVGQRLAAELAEATRPAPIAPLAQLAVLDGLSRDTALRLRPGLRVRLEHRPEEIVLLALDHRIVLSPSMDPAMKVLLTGDPVSAAMLPGENPDELLELVRRLLSAAVLVPADRG
ncbi:MAG: cupin domain-containing protein [Jatrophihabitans sp.]